MKKEFEEKELVNDDSDVVKEEEQSEENNNVDSEEKAEDSKIEKAEDSDDKFRRLMADFQNYKRRTEKERTEIYSYANEKIVSELLLVLDNFERALEHDTEDEKYVDGMKLIFKQLKDTLIKAGLNEIQALGEDFDPNFHNAVMTEDNPEFDSGKVTAELQKGYTLNGKVIRPTMVKVNQ